MPQRHLITLKQELEDAILHGAKPRLLDVVARDTARALGQPVDGPIIKDGNTIADGGESQLLFSARNNRAQWFVQNPLVNTENIYVRIDGADANEADAQSIEIPPGAAAGDDSRSVTQTEIHIIAATTGTLFFAQESLK